MIGRKEKKKKKPIKRQSIPCWVGEGELMTVPRKTASICMSILACLIVPI